MTPVCSPELEDRWHWTWRTQNGQKTEGTWKRRADRPSGLFCARSSMPRARRGELRRGVTPTRLSVGLPSGQVPGAGGMLAAGLFAGAHCTAPGLLPHWVPQLHIHSSAVAESSERCAQNSPQCMVKVEVRYQRPHKSMDVNDQCWGLGTRISSGGNGALWSSGHDC